MVSIVLCLEAAPLAMVILVLGVLVHLLSKWIKRLFASPSFGAALTANTSCCPSQDMGPSSLFSLMYTKNLIVGYEFYCCSLGATLFFESFKFLLEKSFASSAVPVFVLSHYSVLLLNYCISIPQMTENVTAFYRLSYIAQQSYISITLTCYYEIT